MKVAESRHLAAQIRSVSGSQSDAARAMQQGSEHAWWWVVLRVRRRAAAACVLALLDTPKRARACRRQRTGEGTD